MLLFQLVLATPKAPPLIPDRTHQITSKDWPTAAGEEVKKKCKTNGKSSYTKIAFPLLLRRSARGQRKSQIPANCCLRSCICRLERVCAKGFWFWVTSLHSSKWTGPVVFVLVYVQFCPPPTVIILWLNIKFLECCIDWFRGLRQTHVWFSAV